MLLATPLAAQPNLVAPLSPACISSPFGARGPGGPRASRLHSGMDIPAPAGAWVRAAAAGRIAWVRRRGAAGLEVEVVHPGGLATRYAHLGTVAPTIASGRRDVAQGEALGRVGRTGVTYGTHLHFEALVGGVRVDPATLLPLPACVR
ncbi:M23 family metallopeptidase [Plastoroseomonas arctica]|uniref:M23 family metallopeptidase n=1 Tax=Plastoroseomonas arctica TaxID=1509237 RepID=A0AAF1JUM0_9PROT|nr:M23 family metallopeptidase [Plastoroseomonas arctica]MBR0654085.1 M23 family metallopeptidase [Plastoroseomonas arctica]